MSPSRVPDGESRGYIIPIGGAEEKEHDPRILKRFVALCGGSDADIVVIPTASRLADTGSRYERIFRDLGAGRVTALDFDTRRDCFERNRLERLEEANGIFFTGGNQLRLTSILGGTPVAKLVRILNAKGVHTAGTSAGASFLSEHMIAFGQEGAVPTLGCVSLAPGLGLTNRFIIDQHFRQRDRLGRLLSALAFNPFSVGLGLDEDTAAFIGPDNLLEVEGKGGITVVDAAGIEYSGMDDTDPGQPICMLGLTVHILVSGASFNLHTRQAFPGPDARSWAKASS
jgi:cyanophycinase